MQRDGYFKAIYNYLSQVTPARSLVYVRAIAYNNSKFIIIILIIKLRIHIAKCNTKLQKIAQWR